MRTHDWTVTLASEERVREAKEEAYPIDAEDDGSIKELLLEPCWLGHARVRVLVPYKFRRQVTADVSTGEIKQERGILKIPDTCFLVFEEDGTVTITKSPDY